MGAAANVNSETATNATLKSHGCARWLPERAIAISSATAPAEIPTVAASCCPAVYRLVAALIFRRGTSE